jgi:hypothetical protein
MRQLLEWYFTGPISDEFVDLIEGRFKRKVREHRSARVLRIAPLERDALAGSTG